MVGGWCRHGIIMVGGWCRQGATIETYLVALFVILFYPLYQFWMAEFYLLQAPNSSNQKGWIFALPFDEIPYPNYSCFGIPFDSLFQLGEEEL